MKHKLWRCRVEGCGTTTATELGLVNHYITHKYLITLARLAARLTIRLQKIETVLDDWMDEEL